MVTMTLKAFPIATMPPSQNFFRASSINTILKLSR